MVWFLITCATNNNKNKKEHVKVRFLCLRLCIWVYVLLLLGQHAHRVKVRCKNPPKKGFVVQAPDPRATPNLPILGGCCGRRRCHGVLTAYASSLQSDFGSCLVFCVVTATAARPAGPGTARPERGKGKGGRAVPVTTAAAAARGG